MQNAASDLEAGSRSGAQLLLAPVIHTLWPEHPEAKSLIFEWTPAGSKILALDPSPSRRAGLARLQLDAGAVIPGLCDAHLHLAGLGRSTRQLDLRGCQSAEEVATRVAGGIAALREQVQEKENSASDAKPWIWGRGWDQEHFLDGSLPHRNTLDEISGAHPIWLGRVDGHAAWLNSAGLKRLNIQPSTPDPAGGRIVRDQVGNPTGVLIDNALELAGRLLPKRSDSDLREDLLAGVGRCLQFGLGAAHDMGSSAREVSLLQSLSAQGALPLHLVLYLSWNPKTIAGLLSHPPRREGPLQIVGVKLYADGALGSHGAAMETPYADAPGRGLMLTEAPELLARARLASEAGYDVAIHSIGDRGGRIALNVFETLRQAGRRERFRLEHAQLLSEADLDRLAELEVVASMQPTHATSDASWIERRVGRARLAGAYAWRSLQERGARLAFGSDAPIEEANPAWGLHAAVTREDRRGQPAGGFQPQECVDLQTALGAYTHGAAAAAGDSQRGQLRPGAVADFCWLDQDPFAIPSSRLHRLQARGVWVRGQKVC